jgi:hypothetical protein
MTDLPTRALSIRQPWAWAIIAGLKPVENRTWSTNYRGPVLVHASFKMDSFDLAADRDIRKGFNPVTNDWIFDETGHAPKVPSEHQRGGIVGVVDIIDCVEHHSSPWFVGPYGFLLANPRPLPFTPCKGMLGFFTPWGEWTPPDYLDGRGPITDADRLLP